MSIHRRATSKGNRYDVRLRRPDGSAYKRSFPTRKEAERFERAELGGRDRGDWIDPTARIRRFAVLAAEWLASNPAKRPSTRERDRISLDSHILPTFGDRPIGSIRPADVQRWVTALAARRSPRTVARSYGVLRAVANYAVANDAIARTPCRGIKLPAARPATARVLTPGELAALASELGEDYGAMAWLGAVLGLRWGEVAALRVRSVDVLRRTVEVTEQRSRAMPDSPDAFGPPKSHAGRRVVSMPAALADLLAGLMARRGLTAADPDALLFTSPEGQALDYNHWRSRVWYRAAVAAGVGAWERDEATGRRSYVGPGFHDLRRSNATALVAAGVDVKTAQHRLGHSDVRLTLDTYAKVVPEVDRAAADSLGERLMGTG